MLVAQLITLVAGFEAAEFAARKLPGVILSEMLSGRYAGVVCPLWPLRLCACWAFLTRNTAN